MEREEILKYPALSGNIAVMKQLELFESILIEKNTIEEELKKNISEIQNNCHHEWEERKTYDKNIPNCFKSGGHISYGLEVLVSRVCIICGQKEERPKGAPWEICHSCWSPMKWHNVIPGQGDRAQVYECSNDKCNHGSWHT